MTLYSQQPWKFDGLSAMTLYATHNGHAIECNYPHDPDDFARCIQVLRLLFGDDAIQKKLLIQRVAKLYNSRHWLQIAINFDQMQILLEKEEPSGRAPILYALMQEMYEQQ